MQGLRSYWITYIGGEVNKQKPNNNNVDQLVK